MEKLCALRVKMNSLTQRTQRLFNPSTREKREKRKKLITSYLLAINYYLLMLIKS